jgi:methylmalonyl-CoA/ethylmalonyl-CoA epimerase
MHLDHIGIAVQSIEAARGFYESGLGLPATPHIELVAGEKVRVLKLDCGGSHVELIEPTAPDSPIAKFIEKRGPGLHHLCYRTTDVVADMARMKAQGYVPLTDGPRPGADGCLVVFFHPKTTGGVLTELSQAPA